MPYNWHMFRDITFHYLVSTTFYYWTWPFKLWLRLLKTLLLFFPSILPINNFLIKERLKYLAKSPYPLKGFYRWSTHHGIFSNMLIKLWSTMTNWSYSMLSGNLCKYLIWKLLSRHSLNCLWKYFVHPN